MKSYIVMFPASSLSDIRGITEHTVFMSNEYEFLSPHDYSPDDLVICETRNGLSVGKIIREVATTPKATRFILGGFDFVAFLNLVHWDVSQRELRKRINNRIKALDDETRMRQLAASDPELADMVKEYDALRTMKAPVTSIERD